MSNTRRLVLQTFKKLHRTRLKVFQDDAKALAAGRIKINEEFTKNKNVTDEEAIKAMVKFGEDVEKELRTHVVQARQVKPGVFEARITPDTSKLNNIPFNDSAVSEKGVSKGSSCCEKQKPTKRNNY